MIITLLGTGLGGAFFHYMILFGIQGGKLSKGAILWTDGVAVPAFMFASCASVVVAYFFEDVGISLALALWPVFILALHPAYRLTERKGKDSPQTAEDEK